MNLSLKKIEKRTQYDLVKRTKMENFRLLNGRYTRRDQTVLLGDSITEIFNWYELFESFTRETGQSVYNRGISGDTSDRLLERLEPNALNIAPRNLVILIGTNDLGVGAPISFTVENVEKILRRSRKTLPELNLVLQAVYPVNKHLNSAAQYMVGRRKNETIAQLNAELRPLAEQYGAHWLNLTPNLTDAQGNLSGEYCYDGLHLNARGFEIAAQGILPLLAR